jgi:hypothetical protein
VGLILSKLISLPSWRLIRVFFRSHGGNALNVPFLRHHIALLIFKRPVLQMPCGTRSKMQLKRVSVHV